MAPADEMEAQKLRDLAERLKSKSGRFWKSFASTEALMGWLRWRGRCVYCGTELVDDRHMIDGLATTDHLLPRTKYQESPSLDFSNSKLPLRDYLNTVPACDGCNGLKRSWDPNLDDPLYGAEKGVPLDKDMQVEFIERARRYIESERKRRGENYAQDIEHWRDALKELDGH